ncbi:hypothetical protein D9Q98_000736 [Chlorella vulgaris]|uniref:Uncharacterized protein n=1 Tax=Chlorella vulgaris TaxID=3077 RepID=A0A9D4TYY4_CHLVU|nr:hypothetical protein D9Q98_000736 [Chlorella vulgaris]
MEALVKHGATAESGRPKAPVAAPPTTAVRACFKTPAHWQPLQSEPSHDGAAVASADEGQMQFLLSALRVALGKKEAALVSVAAQMANVQGRLQQCEAQKLALAGQVQTLQQATRTPEPLPAATSVTPDGRLLAQARHELGRESARAAELAAERDTLQHDVALLRKQLIAAAQAEAVERERLCCASAVKQVDDACAEAASAVSAAAQANARVAAAEAEAAHLRQQLDIARDTGMKEGARVSATEADLAEARQQMDWQTLRIAELQQSSGMGQLMRKYDSEVQRLRTQFDAERHSLKAQLVQAQAQAKQHQQQQQQSEYNSNSNLPQLDSSAWRALFDEEEPSQQLATKVHSASTQTEAGEEQQQVHSGGDPALLLEAAQLEIERLQELNSGLDASLLEMRSQAQQAQQAALEQQRQKAAGIQREHQITLDAVRRSEAGLRQRLSTAELQLTHRSGEVHALREANDKLELALAALKEELDSVLAQAQAPRQDVEELRSQLLQAVAHTQALEAQVQQMKLALQAAATAQQHKLDVEARLADAHNQLAAARSERTAMQQAQAQVLHICEPITWQAMQGTFVPAMTAASAGADVQPPAVEPDATRTPAKQPPPPLQPYNIADVQQQLSSELSSACPSPACCSGISSRSPVSLPLEMTAKQLQLELARVRITAASSGMRASSWARQAVLRVGSSQVDHASDVLSPRLSGMAALRQALASAGSLGGNGNSRQWELCSNEREEGGQRCEEDDSCFATPLAQTPTCQSTNELSPFALESEEEHGQLRRLGRLKVPALNLDCIQPELSPEPLHKRLAAPGSSGSLSDGLDSASTSASSLSSRLPTTRTFPTAATGCSRQHSETNLELSPGSNFAQAKRSGTSWTSASLDASLNRLAKLTAGLLPARP